jgi:VWFA-related protein
MLAKLIVIIALLVFGFSITTVSVVAQTPQEKPTPSTGSKDDEQERVKIFTEEVVLPIVAYDAYGHFDPSINSDDVLVLEDGVSQQVKSARRIPLNVILLIDMGSVVAATQHLDVSRQIAMHVISKLRPGDRMALIQFTNRAEVLQDWTDDTQKLVKALNPEHGKLLSGNSSRISAGLKAAADELKGKEAGSTHVVLITDGDEAPGTEYTATIKQLLRMQPAVHVLSYTTLASQEVRKRKGGMLFDRARKRFYKDYENAIKDSERQLTALAENLGGRIFLPTTTEEALMQGDELAGEIGATCVLTYTPKRPLESSDDTKPRHIEVFPRRPGLRVRALRTTVLSTSRLAHSRSILNPKEAKERLENMAYQSGEFVTHTASCLRGYEDRTRGWIQTISI